MTYVKVETYKGFDINICVNDPQFIYDGKFFITSQESPNQYLNPIGLLGLMQNHRSYRASLKSARYVIDRYLRRSMNTTGGQP